MIHFCRKSKLGGSHTRYLYFYEYKDTYICILQKGDYKFPIQAKSVLLNVFLECHSQI